MLKRISKQTSRPPARGSGRHAKTKTFAFNHPTVAQNLAESSAIEDGDLFLFTKRDGAVPFDEAHSFGLYYHDCCYLDGYRMTLNGKDPIELACLNQGFESEVLYASPCLLPPDPRHNLEHQQTVSIRWTHLVSQEELTLFDTIEIGNHGSKTLDLELALFFRARFRDIFVIRGIDERLLGKAQPPRWQGDVLVFDYVGADRTPRRLSVRFPEPPSSRNGTQAGAHERGGRTQSAQARFDFRLKPEQTRRIDLSFLIEEGTIKDAGAQPLPKAEELSRRYGEDRRRHHADNTQVASDWTPLRSALSHSLRDMRMLQSSYAGHEFYLAGLPWFAALFGRDAIVAALQMLAFRPDMAVSTLRLLASHQGKRVDDWREERPGCILSELRFGELARAKLMPHSGYYGTIDATPLFLVLLAEHARWTGSLELFRELRDAVDKALRWMSDFGDGDGDGYLDYKISVARGAVANKGWKDSMGTIVNGDGSLARSPIAVAEAQGYMYMAKLGIAGLMRRNGEEEAARTLEREAESLRKRFNKDYWMPDAGFFALALGAGKQADVVSSNGGQVLWTGIADPAHAREVKNRLMAEDMFNGWGVRCLSSREMRYNPVGYHLGAVWPHDNSLIAAGLRRYGFDEEALRIFEGMLHAAPHFHEGRLPEAFCGFSRADFPRPVPYPVANCPQAWASAALPYLLSANLGLEPNAFAGELIIRRPSLPTACKWIELRRLKVGKAHIDLRFEREAGRIAVRETGKSGELEIIVEET